MNTYGNRWLLITVLGLSVVLASGCAGTPTRSSGGGQVTPEQQQLRQQARAYNKTVLQGAAAGAAVGGAVAALRGGNRRDIATGAVIGGVVGGAAGAYYASKQRNYANKEALLDSLIADARQRNEETGELVVMAETVVQQQSTTLADLRRQYADGEVERMALQRQIQIASEDRDLLRESIAVAQDQVQTFTETRNQYVADHPGQDVSAYDGEIATIAERIRQLESITNQLTENIDAASVG